MIQEADITFTSTGAQEPILTNESLKNINIENSRKMLVDISVPRNIYIENAIDGIDTYDVDDL